MIIICDTGGIVNIFRKYPSFRNWDAAPPAITARDLANGIVISAGAAAG